MTASLDVDRTEAVDAGRDWDAVKTPLHTAYRVHGVLLDAGHTSGPVLLDLKRKVGYFFVPPRTLAGNPPGAVVISKGVVTVPRYPLSDARDRRYWTEYGAQPPGPGNYADVDALVEALERIDAADRALTDRLVGSEPR